MKNHFPFLKSVILTKSGETSKLVSSKLDNNKTCRIDTIYGKCLNSQSIAYYPHFFRSSKQQRNRQLCVIEKQNFACKTSTSLHLRVSLVNDMTQEWNSDLSSPVSCDVWNLASINIERVYANKQPVARTSPATKIKQIFVFWMSEMRWNEMNRRENTLPLYETFVVWERPF